MSRRAPGDPLADPFAELLVDDPHVRTLTLALNYDCNSRCRFCFVETELDLKLAPVTDAFITRVFEENLRRRLFDRIVLSGAEATLRRDLPSIANRALRRGGFEAVQIQTNGRRLSDRGYLMELLAAGVSEFFVSVHAGDPELDAWLTRSPESFDEMRRGLQNLLRLGCAVVTNTVITRGSYQHLPRTADFLVAEGVPECHFWAFVEFGDVGQRVEHAPYGAAAPFLKEAIDKLKAAGRRAMVSWFPVCLLDEHAGVVRNHRSNTLIHDSFRSRVQSHGSFTCPRSDECAEFGRSCVGLHERYRATIGDVDDLRPYAEPLDGGPRGDALMDGMPGR